MPPSTRISDETLRDDLLALPHDLAAAQVGMPHRDDSPFTALEEADQMIEGVVSEILVSNLRCPILFCDDHLTRGSCPRRTS